MFLCSWLSMEGPQEVNHPTKSTATRFMQKAFNIQKHASLRLAYCQSPVQRPSWRTNLSESLIDCNLLPENQSAPTLLGWRCAFEGELFWGAGVSPMRSAGLAPPKKNKAAKQQKPSPSRVRSFPRPQHVVSFKYGIDGIVIFGAKLNFVLAVLGI